MQEEHENSPGPTAVAKRLAGVVVFLLGVLVVVAICGQQPAANEAPSVASSVLSARSDSADFGSLKIVCGSSGRQSERKARQASFHKRRLLGTRSKKFQERRESSISKTRRELKEIKRVERYVEKKPRTSSAGGCKLEAHGNGRCGGGTAQIGWKPGEWNMVGSRTSNMGSRTSYVYLGFFDRGQCARAKNARDMPSRGSCILLNQRYSSKASATYSQTMRISGFPKSIAEPGQCFTKCRDVPWMMLTGYQQASRAASHYLCRNAKILGCVAPNGRAGYVDKTTGAWKTC